MMNPLRLTWCVAIVIGLPACAWLPPAPHLASMRHEAPLAATVAASQDAWPTANWWEQYGDDTLNNLMIQALATAPSLATAEARFNNARESVRVTAAIDGLRVDARGDVERQRLSDNGLIPPKFLGFQWYNQADLGLQASYSFDWWHKRRATITAAIDDAQAARLERSAAAISLGAAIADSYFGWQADQAQLTIARDQQALATRRRDITQARVAAELEAVDMVYISDAEIANLRESIVSLQYSAELRRVALAALLGVSTDTLPVFTAKPLPLVRMQLPNEVRIDLLARRADISASRWQVDAAQQRLGAARAEFLPDISLNALVGLSSIELSKLFNAGSAVPAITAAVHLPLFDSGRLRAQYGARAAQVNAAIANYNQTVVVAAREVATQTLKLQQIAAQLSERAAQIKTTTQLVEVAQTRNQQGLTDARPRLAAAQALQQQQAALTNLDAAAISAEINLILALGGGYQAAVTDAASATSTSGVGPTHDTQF